MDKDEIQKRVSEDEDYIRCPKCSNSLTKFLSKHADAVPDNVISRLLMRTEEEVEKLYQEAIEMIKKEMKKDDYGEEE